MKKPQLVFACNIADENARKRIEQWVDIKEVTVDSPQSLLEECRDADGIIVGYTSHPMITREVIDGVAGLRLVGTTYGGVRQNVDDQYALSSGLTVIHTGASRVRPMAQYTLALILSSLMHIHLYHHDMRAGEQWPRFKYPRGRILQDRSVGVIGYGRIGEGIVRMLQSFTSHVAVCSRHLSAEVAADARVSLKSLNELCADAEIIVLAGGYNPETHHMIGREQFARMQQDALFVNIARGKMVHEAALIEALQASKIYAALDVFEEEPLPADSPLRQSDRVLLTPHRANNAIEFEQRWETLADEIEAFYSGKQPDSSLNAERARAMSES